MSIEALKAEYENAPREQRQAVLAKMYQSLEKAPKAELDAATAQLLPLILVPSPNQAADVALTLGAFVELGADPRPLAKALLAPLTRWVSAAARFASQVADFDDAPDDVPEADVIGLDDRRIFRADVDQLHEEDPEAVASWFSMEVWFRPAVASLTRSVDALRTAREDSTLREALNALEDLPGGARWLRVLLDSCAGERLVFVVPELKEAFELQADGVVDVVQLSVLIAMVLAGPLARIQASGPADASLIKTMLGEGPQQTNGSYGAHFFLYPWRAMNPQTRLPEDERHWWHAPGGRGSHSLPADFQPATVEPLDDARVFFLVGPQLPTLKHRFVRSIGGTRMFDKLTARLSEPVAVDYEKWLARIFTAVTAAN